MDAASLHRTLFAGARCAGSGEVPDRAWAAETLPSDDHLAVDGRVLELLSEHTCQGWLEGYLLAGRHGFFSCTKPSFTSWTRCSTSTRND
jgi:phosphoketolase